VDAEPGTYFITFTGYGTWVPGDQRGSSERLKFPGITVTRPEDRWREKLARNRMAETPMMFGGTERSCIADAITSVCDYCQWPLLALNVRTNHVHVVVVSSSPAERVMNGLKAWSTRRLREAGLIDGRNKVWTRHGSTRYLFTPADVARAVEYVVEGQGVDLGSSAGPNEDLSDEIN
jgi:REP element-mobilizing transposase RayT